MSTRDPAAVSWARAVLGRAEISWVRSRPWSDLAEVRAADRLWWLKINKAGTVYETRLLDLLGRVDHRLIPETITHPSQPWCLIADAGRRLDQLGLDRQQELAIWTRVLPAYAELQQAVPLDQLEAVGVPDFRPGTLASWHADLVARFDGDPAARAHLTALELDALTTLGPWVGDLADELAAGVPPTLQHDDLHQGNVLVTDHDHLTLIDWGDSVISHPFSTLRVTLSRLQRSWEVGPDDPDLRRLRDAYLEAWQGSRPELLRQSELAFRLGSLYRVYANYRAFDALEPAISPDQRGDGLFWVREMIKDAALPLPRCLHRPRGSTAR